MSLLDLLNGAVSNVENFVAPKKKKVAPLPASTAKPRQYNLSGLNSEDTQVAQKLINKGADPTKYISTAKQSNTTAKSAAYQNSGLGKFLNTGAQVGRSIAGGAVDTANFLTRIPETVQATGDSLVLAGDKAFGLDNKADLAKALLHQKSYADMQAQIGKITQDVAGDKSADTTKQVNDEANRISTGKGTAGDFLNAGLASINAASVLPISKVAGTAVSTVARTGEKAAKDVIKGERTVTQVDSHPAIQELNNNLAFLRQHDEQMSANGLSPNNPSRINNIKAQQATLNELSSTRQKVAAQLKRDNESGFIKLPGKEETLDNVNPTGTVFTKYDPSSRASMKIGSNLTTLDKTIGGKSDETVTIYRGAPSSQSKISAGDFVTTNKQLAKDYGGGHVIEQQVPKGHVLDDATEPGGEEYIYRPGADKELLERSAKLAKKREGQSGFIKLPGKDEPIDTPSPQEIPNQSQVEKGVVSSEVRPTTRLVDQQAPQSQSLERTPAELNSQVNPYSKTLPQDGGTVNPPTVTTKLVEPPIQKQSSFTAKTVPASENVSDPLKSAVSENKALYKGTTNQGHLEQGLKNLQGHGTPEAMAEDVAQRLNAENGHINSQDVADTLTAAQALDVRGDTASIDKAAALYEKLAEHLTAAGQTSQAASLILRRSAEGLQLGAYRQLQRAGVPITDEIRDSIIKATQKIKGLPVGSQAHADAVQELLKTVAENVPPSLIKNLTGVWKAGLLSGVKTTGGNIVSNATFSGLKKISDIPTTIADKGISLFTGKRSVTNTGKGSISGAKEGIDNAVYTMKTGIDRRNVADTADKYEQHQGIQFKNDWVQKIVGKPANTVFNFLGAQDQPFYYSNLRNSLKDQAYTEARNRGLKSSEKLRFVNDFVTNPPETAKQTAINEANKSVLGYDTVAYSAIKGMKQGIKNLPENVFPKASKEAAAAVIDLIAPFARVPSAFISRVVDFTPLGLPKEVLMQVAKRQFSQRSLSKAIGESSTGTGVIALGAALSAAGLISGDYPKSDNKKAALWKAQGITPNSVKIGNTWTSMNYLGPIGLLFNAGNKVRDALEKGGTAVDGATQAVAGLGQGLLGQSFLQGFSGLSDAISNPEQNLKSYLNSEAGSLVPNLSNDIANATDSFQRQVNTGLDAVKAKIPGLREGLNKKTDTFGNDLKQASGNGLNTAVNPLKPSNQINTPLLSELSRLADTGFETIPTPDKSLSVSGKNVTLTPDQLNKYTKDTGQATQKAWNYLITTAEYKSLSDEDKSKYLVNAMDDINAVVKKNTLNSIGQNDLADAVKLTGNQKLLAASIGEGVSDSSTYQVRTPTDTSSGTSTKATKLDPKSIASTFLTASKSVDDTDSWNSKSVDTKYQSLVDTANASIPDGLAKLPNTNAVAKIMATYQKAKADGDWSDLQATDEIGKAIVSGYKSALTKDEKYISGLSDTDIKTAVGNGQVTKAQLDHIINVDNESVKLGASQNISNKTRTTLGYGTIATKASAAASSKKTISDYISSQKKTNDTALAGDKALRELLKGIKYTKKSTKVKVA